MLKKCSALPPEVGHESGGARSAAANPNLGFQDDRQKTPTLSRATVRGNWPAFPLWVEPPAASRLRIPPSAFPSINKKARLESGFFVDRRKSRGWDSKPRGGRGFNPERESRPVSSDGRPAQGRRFLSIVLKAEVGIRSRGTRAARLMPHFRRQRRALLQHWLLPPRLSRSRRCAAASFLP